MFPILFEFPGFVLYTQTVCIALAFIVGLLVTLWEGKRFNLAQFDLTTVALWGFLASIVGARLLFLSLSWDAARFTFIEICTLGTSDGGFALHGGLIAGGLAIFWGTRYYKLPLWRTGDVLAAGLALAMFFLRLGCLLNGCDYGTATTLPWGIFLHDAYRHPIQLYEGLGNLLLLPLVLTWNKKPYSPGVVCCRYFLLSGVIRFGVDFYRAEDPRIWDLFTIPQLLALGIVVLSGYGLYYRVFRTSE